MKKLIHPINISIVLFLSVMLFACKKETFNENTPVKDIQDRSVHADHILSTLRDNGVRDISLLEIKQALSSRSSVLPCEWDFDMNGSVETDDLLEVLGGYGTNYFTQDLLDLISVYGIEYIVDVVPLWNNYIQDVNCDLDWTNFPRVKCGEVFLTIETEQLDSVHWIQNDSIVWTDPVEMNWKSYPPDAFDCSDTLGYQPPCNGIQTVTQRIFFNGYTYARTNTGFALMNNAPVESCGGSPFNDVEWMSFNATNYTNLEFLEE